MLNSSVKKISDPYVCVCTFYSHPLHFGVNAFVKFTQFALHWLALSEWICLAFRGYCCSVPSKNRVQTPRFVMAGGLTPAAAQFYTYMAAIYFYFFLKDK